MTPREKVYISVLLTVGISGIVLILLFTLGGGGNEDEAIQPLTLEEKKHYLRDGAYAHLDKICRDVNILDKIQIAIYFLMQSWLKLCDTTPNTMVFAPLKLMKKKIHDAVTKRIHDFNAKEERTVEDCVIEYYNSEIVDTKDDFHLMLFELILQGYVNTFKNMKDLSGDFIKMETINCNETADCEYSFLKPPTTSRELEKIVNKTVGESEEEIHERKCIQLFHYLYLWNEKIRHPEWLDWTYYLLFKGLQAALKASVEDIRRNLHCSSDKMEVMEQAMMAKESEIDPSVITFLRERDLEIEIVEDDIEYAATPQQNFFVNRLGLENAMAEMVIQTYINVTNITPKNGKISILSPSGKPFEIEVPTMDHIELL